MNPCDLRHAALLTSARGDTGMGAVDCTDAFLQVWHVTAIAGNALCKREYRQWQGIQPFVNRSVNEKAQNSVVYTVNVRSAMLEIALQCAALTYWSQPRRGKCPIGLQ